MPDHSVTSGGLLAGKHGLIMGVANERSLAWGIARIAAAQGARLAFSYPNDAVRRRVKTLTAALGPSALIRCDVSSDADLDRLPEALAETWPDEPLDFVV